MKINPCSAQAARYSPFSVTLAWAQVSPDKYQTTGSFPPRSACGGRKIDQVMSVEVAVDAWRTTSCRPPCDLVSETTSSVTAPAGEAHRACCRRDRADRRDRAYRNSLRECRADLRSPRLRPRRRADATHRLPRGCHN